MRRALAALVGSCAVGLAACNPSPPAVSVLVVTLDTTRADHLGSYGATRARTPNLDALAAQGIRYQHAYSPAPITLPAHASLLTGLYPFEHRVRGNGDFRLSDCAQTLAEVLQRQGYRTGAAVGAFVLDRRFGLAQGFDWYDDAISEQRTSGSFGFAERPAPAVTDAALAWLSEQPPNRPFFLWVHYFDPHAGYESHAAASEFSGLPPYDAEIAFVDREIGRLLGWLRESGRDTETLVVAAADHGEGLWEHGEISHGYFVYDSTLRAALIVRLPDRAHAGSAVAAPVSLVDVFPTVLERLGIPVGDVSGETLPLVEHETGAAPRSIYFENYAVATSFGLSPLRGIVRGRDKWIEAPRPERYDLVSDPHEIDNRHQRDDPGSAELRAAFERFLDDDERRLPDDCESSFAVDADTAARLNTLGYAAGFARREPGDRVGGPDPKDAVEDHRAILDAEARVGVGQRAQAAEVLAAIVGRIDYVNPRALTRLAELAVAEPGRETAIAALLPYLERDLDPALHFTIAAKLGVGLGRIGRYAEAVHAFEIAARLGPDNAEVRRGLEAARRLQIGVP
ncbi:MAG: sulfatase [Deltaproteobacteria bacterium]|nr:sulfatase [Deltaproteobacteria bacterium]